jgi:hypothetical protein
MSIFATGPSGALSFIVKNITSPPGRIIKVFGTKIYPGQLLDLMQIPGVAEEDIRASLIKGDLGNKIRNKQLKMAGSPEILTSELGNDILNILGPSTTIRPVPIVPAIIKSLTNNIATPLFYVDLSKTVPIYGTKPDYTFGGKVFFAAECNDGYDVQIREGDVNIAAAMRVGIGPIITAQAVNATQVLTSGTFITTFSWSISDSIATFQITAASSLASADIDFHYFLLHVTHREPSFGFL